VTIRRNKKEQQDKKKKNANVQPTHSREEKKGQNDIGDYLGGPKNLFSLGEIEGRKKGGTEKNSRGATTKKNVRPISRKSGPPKKYV